MRKIVIFNDSIDYLEIYTEDKNPLTNTITITCHDPTMFTSCKRQVVSNFVYAESI